MDDHGHTVPEPPRPGMPRVAAWRARNSGERLTAYEAYLDALATVSSLDETVDVAALRAMAVTAASAAGDQPVPVPGSVLVALLDEITALQSAAENRMGLLADAADREARRWDDLLAYPLVRLAEDCYIAWSGVCDAPVGWTMTRAEARDRGWTESRLAKAEDRDPEEHLGNRAGPNEAPLTAAALVEAYASTEAHTAFRLTPEKVHCSTTQDAWREGEEWKYSEPYWSPWDPAETPDALPDHWTDRF